jgi:hypothetical protein
VGFSIFKYHSSYTHLTCHTLSPCAHVATIFKLDALLASAADSMEEERKALAVERNKTVMARLLAGEITAFEG